MTPGRISAYLLGSESLVIHLGEALLGKGHSVLGVFTSDLDVAAWAMGKGILVHEELQRHEQADFLFSVDSASQITPQHVELARQVIDFHDGPLPRYRGRYPTTRALLAGEPEHGVTWGNASEIWKVKTFDISEGETCFSLNAKCYEAGIDSFAELLDEIARGDASAVAVDVSVSAIEGLPQAAAVLDFTQPADDLALLVRGLDFGPVANPIALPKVHLPSGFVAVREAEARPSDASDSPGTVLSASQDAIEIACGDGTLVIKKWHSLDGRDAQAAAAGTTVGALINRDDVTQMARLSGESEQLWVQQLASLNPCSVPLAAARQGASRLRQRSLALPSGCDLLRIHLVWLARVCDQRTFDVLYRDAALAETTRELEQLFAPAVPLRVSLDFHASVDAATIDIPTSTYARDALARYPDLANVFEDQLPRVAVFHDTPVTDAVPFDLAIVISGDACTWHFDASVYSDEAITAMIAQLTSVGEADGGTAIAQLPLLSDDDRKRLLVDFNATDRAYDREQCVHRAFVEQAAQTPDAIALVSGNDSMTYRELDARTNQLARHLRKLGIKADTPVGLHADRSLQMVVGLVGIMKAGGAYVPMDPKYPAERIAFMHEDSGVSLTVGPDNDWDAVANEERTPLADEVAPHHLAYMIYTSGSTGLPKGVMVEHRNVINFFAGMDDRVGRPNDACAWLALTSLSFDISVLELLWTLTRGVKVVLHDEAAAVTAGMRPITFSLMYFASDEGENASTADKYRLLLEGAKFGDRNGFSAVWTPERHFHAFGGLYPNPSVASAAIAAITERIGIRAGSCVLPLHHPIRVAEEWALVDNLSKGRVGIAFASGWQPNDFILRPGSFKDRKAIMLRDIETVRKLWRGESITAESPTGETIEVRSLPRPVQAELPFWVTAAGNPETFRAAGQNGANVLTHLLGQTIEDVSEKIGIYRAARKAAGHAGRGEVTVMLHTFVGPDEEMVRETVRGPMKEYLRSAVGLIKLASWSFPTFKQKGAATGRTPAEVFEQEDLSEEELDALLEHAFARYYETSGLFGTVASCLKVVESLRGIGVDDIACLLDYGVPSAKVLEHLPYLNEVKTRASTTGATIAEEIRAHRITHLQCTPSELSLILADDGNRAALGTVGKIMIGGEEFPAPLASELKRVAKGDVINMYGPTETTIWSSTQPVRGDEQRVSIGTPIANTSMYILDRRRHPVPAGVPGELYIGGDGVVRGYHRRPELTAERFVDDPFAAEPNARMYRTGDGARFTADGQLEFLGRLDFQVKLRGYRIELGEIEARIREYGVTKTVCIVREDVPGDKRLVAYCVGDFDAAGLRVHLTKSLPDYMVPSHIVRLETFPLTPNRKIDRKALPPPNKAPALRKSAYVAPSNELEQTVAKVWADALNVKEVGAEDNFFDLGGHSLLVVQVHRQLRDAIERPVSLTDLFRFPTIRSLVGFLSDSGQEKSATDKSESRAEARKAAAARRAALRDRRRRGKGSK